MDKIISLLINSGYQIKKIHNTADGVVIDFMISGKSHRIFLAPLKHVKFESLSA